MQNNIKGFYSFFKDEDKNVEVNTSNSLFNKFLEEIKFQYKNEDDIINLLNINMKNIFQSLKDKDNVLIAGEVQSGKTNNMIGSIFMGIDSGFDCIVVLGGTTNMLLEQFIDRINKSLNYNETEIVFYNQNKTFPSLTLLKKDRAKIVINILKNESQISKIEQEISALSNEFKVLIIDDECDYASLNTKTIGESKIYSLISDLKTKNNAKYLGITATPYGNIMNTLSPSIFPESIVKLHTSSMYTGIDYFNEKKYFQIFETEKEDDFDNISYLIEEFFNYYILSTNFAYKYGLPYTTGIINIDIVSNNHERIEDMLTFSAKKFWNCIRNGISTRTIDIIIEKFNNIANFSIEDIKKQNLDIKSQRLNYKNKKNEILANESVIYIGGNLVSRGITFPNLIAELMINIRKDKQPIDILLQRSRWFGYRHFKVNDNIYFDDIMKIFISNRVWECLKESFDVNNLLYNDLLKKNLNNDIENIKLNLELQKNKFKYIVYSDKEK